MHDVGVAVGDPSGVLVEHGHRRGGVRLGEERFEAEQVPDLDAGQRLVVVGLHGGLIDGVLLEGRLGQQPQPGDTALDVGGGAFLRDGEEQVDGFRILGRAMTLRLRETGILPTDYIVVGETKALAA